jgi:hypothetical protein
MGNVVIEPLVQRHNAADRAYREVGPCQQAPDPELAGIGMALLEMVHRHHHRKPHLARPLGAALAVDESGKMLRLEVLDPPVHGRARDPQKPAETDLVPALIVESDDLQASVEAIGMGAIVQPCRLLRSGDRTLLPKLLDRVVMDGVAEGEEQDAGEFAVMKAAIERFEPVNLLADRIWNPLGPALGSYFEVGGHQPQHPLPLEAVLEGADGVRMGLRFLGPLLGRPIGEQYEGTDDLIAPLDLIHEAQLQLRKRRGRFHGRPFTRAAGEGLM